MEDIIKFLNAYADIIGLLVTITGLLFIWLRMKHSIDIAKLQTTPLLSIELVNNEELRYDGKSFCYDDGNRIVNPKFRILNLGGSPVIVTGFLRTWSTDKHNKLPEPLKLSDLDVKHPSYKKTQINISANGKSEPIATVYPTPLNLDTDGIERIFFHGLIEYKDVLGRKYLAGFKHVYRFRAKKAGMHIALPRYAAELYNFNRKI